MPNQFHKNLTSTDIHVIHAFTFPDATARNAATFLTEDIGKVARQSDNDTYYILVNTTPTWSQIDPTGFDTFIEMTDTPSTYTSGDGKVIQVNSGGTGLEFGQALRTVDSPTFTNLNLTGGIANLVGDFTISATSCLEVTSDSDLFLTSALGELDLDAQTFIQITAATGNVLIRSFGTTSKIINTLGTTTSATSFVVQDSLNAGLLTVLGDGNVGIGTALPLAELHVIGSTIISGDLTVRGTTTTIDTANLLVEDKNIIIGNVATPTDVTADGGGITLLGTTNKTILNISATNSWDFSQNVSVQGNITLTGTVDGIDIAIDVPLNTTHRTSDGSDHSFINQSVTTTSLPTFAQVNVDNLRLDGNIISSTDTNGNILLIPNGTGSLAVSTTVVIGSTSLNPDGTLHVHTGSAGAVTASSVADGIVVEDSTNTGISILTPDASVGRVVFGSLSDPFGAFMAWGFSGSDFSVGTSKIGASFRLTSDQETTNLTLSGASGSELANFAKDVTINGRIRITGGIPALDRVLTSIDLDGNAEWRVLPVSVGWVGGGGVVSLNTSTDSVGIGTQTPDTKLHVENGSAGAVTAFVGTIATFESSGAGYLSILTPDVSTSGILFGEPSNNLAGGIFYNDPGSPDGFQFRVNGNLTKMVIEKDGAVGIGTTNPDFTSILDLSSTTEGFLSPRMTETQRDAISSPATGLKIYNTTINKYEIFTGTVWDSFLTEALGTFTAQETFASTNVRFFGEFGVPQDQGWIDTATGIATIDLQDQTVFGVLKQVVRHNDNTTGGSTTSKIALTAQNWIDINNFGASYSGISRLDTVNGGSGFFSGLQANAAENPLVTGNRRYGILFNNNAGNLRLIEADNNPGNSVTMDGTGGNPLITFDEWFSWECVVPVGLGAAQVFINGILTTFVPLFLVNGGGLGTQIIVSSGSTGGANRVSYHDNFGTTIFEESATKTLAAATMDADIAQITIPEGRRDYIIILPDGNPRAIGSLLRVVVNNLFGTVTLQNQTPAAPEALFNGLAEIVFTVFSKEIVGGVNTVDQANVYIGFKAEDVDRASSIFAQLHSIIDQIPTDVNPTVITYTNHDAINGIGHSTTINTGELEILPGLEGTYFVMAQPQVGKTQGATGVDFDMFLQVDRGSGFVDEPNSNIKLTIKDQDITDVIVSAFSIQLNVGDKIRMMQKVSDSGVGMGLKNTDPVVGPPTVPRTPSIIFTMYRIGGI